MSSATVLTFLPVLLIIAVIFTGKKSTCQPTNPNAYCLTSFNKNHHRRDDTYNYAYTEDCHVYLQCFISNNGTSAIGYIRRCQQGSYWDDSDKTCALEGLEKCSPHPCKNPEIAAFGKYHVPGMPCNTFFLCGFNKTQCCDSEQRFNPETGDCDYDPSCREQCESKPIFLPEPVRLTPSSCRDIYGNVLKSQPNPRKFYLGDAILECAAGSQFDLESCRCNTPSEIVRPRLPNEGKMCDLWLPFDSGVGDLSNKRHSVFAMNGANIDRKTTARGSGSLRVIGNHSHISVPGLKNVDLGYYKEASWCYFFRCGDGDESFLCHEKGGILSNNHDDLSSDFSFIAAINPEGRLVTRIATSSNPGPISFDLTYEHKIGWNHVCTVWEASQVRTYINTVLVSTEAATGNLTRTNYPYVIGTDQFYGSFIGNIDEVLMCNHAISVLEIQAHYSGNHAVLRNTGLIP